MKNSEAKEAIRRVGRVRTADPLTGSAGYTDEANSMRRAGAHGRIASVSERPTIVRVRHEADGTVGSYDPAELTEDPTAADLREQARCARDEAETLERRAAEMDLAGGAPSTLASVRFRKRFTWRPTEAEAHALRLVLCGLHGRPEGVALDEPSPPALVEAQERLRHGHAEQSIDVDVEVSADGSVRLLAAARPEEKPPLSH